MEKSSSSQCKVLRYPKYFLGLQLLSIWHIYGSVFKRAKYGSFIFLFGLDYGIYNMYNPFNNFKYSWLLLCSWPFWLLLTNFINIIFSDENVYIISWAKKNIIKSASMPLFPLLNNLTHISQPHHTYYNVYHPNLYKFWFH